MSLRGVCPRDLVLVGALLADTDSLGGEVLGGEVLGGEASGEYVLGEVLIISGS